MSERKAINKYYPPDYDPAKAEKLARSMSKKLKSSDRNESSIRLMTPFSMRCLKCDEYIPKSRKFNGKKKVLDEKYLGSIKMFQFTIRCPQCANTISFRTDPKSSDYVMVVGGVRNYVQRKDEEDKAKKETLQETLERLAREKELEESDGKGLPSGKGKMELLEDRLSKLQKQQKDAETLEKLIEKNQQKLELSEKLTFSTLQPETAIEDNALNKAVANAFASENSQGTVISPPSAPPPLQKPKITMKIKKKSLGIVKKRNK
ncbi:hypothetical protein RNJ44_02644 [Nakaseomyces bracarensis]|uniref:Splicing factor YJU2 n=1 Tax=Nakaseomyces bracarensis TaxID=273131 RepID=A0ABR4NZU5_9SACH